MQSIDVFISYKREERSLADQVARALKEAGYVAVTDLNIQKATDFGEAIDGMIRAAKVVVVLWTKASAASDWVRLEAREGKRRGKYFGVRIESIEADDIPVEVRNDNWLNLADVSLPEGLPEFVDEIRRMIGDPQRSHNEAESETKLAEGDLEFYQVVHEIGEVGGYRRYIRVYPKGTYVEDAKAHIKRLTRWWSPIRRFPIFGVITAVGTCVGAFVALNPFFTSEAQRKLQAENVEIREELESLRRERERLVLRLAAALETPRIALASLDEPAEENRPCETSPGTLGIWVDEECKTVDDYGRLNLSGTSIIDLDAITRLTGLKKLNLSRTQVEDLSPLSGLSDLEELTLANTPNVRDFSFLETLTGLTELNLEWTDVEDLDPLAGMTTLETLYLMSTNVVDIGALSELSQLQTLYLGSTKVADLSPLGGLQNLRFLMLENTEVTDLNPLSRLEELEHLYLNNSKVRDVTPLGKVTDLKFLELAQTPVTDLTALLELHKLHYIVLPDGHTHGDRMLANTDQTTQKVHDALMAWASSEDAAPN